MLEKSFTLLFYLKKPKNYLKGPMPIYMRITVDGIRKGGESNDAMKVLGKIGAGEGIDIPYKLLSLNNLNSPIYLSTNSLGEIWLIAGVDSGYEGVTTLYYKQITVFLER